MLAKKDMDSVASKAGRVSQYHSTTVLQL
jgi:hypothetical protein